MILSFPRRRGEPDLYTAPAPAARPARRFRLLLTRLPGRWELIIFDRARAAILRRFEGRMVDALWATRALPEGLRVEGACDADKSFVRHLFLAAASLARAVDPCGHRPGPALPIPAATV